MQNPIAGPGARENGRTALRLAGAAFACLAGAGLMLWWRHGDQIFGQYLVAALAWCF